MNPNHSKRPRLLALAALAVTGAIFAVPAPSLAAAEPRPTTYVVSDAPDTVPEGIHVTRDGTMYVTSKGTGTVYRGSTHKAQLDVFLPGGADGRVTATGVHVDPWGRVLVAGAETSAFFAYSPSGELLAKRTVPEGAFLNDFVVSRGYLYVTDSWNGTVYRASIDEFSIGELEPWLTADRFSVMPDFLNGIAATSDGRHLIVADWLVERTYLVDVAARTAEPIDVRGGTLGGDGLLLEGHTLYAVHTETADDGTSTVFTRAVELADDWRSARVIGDSAAAPAGQMPTTIARDRGRLLWVQSQMDVWPGVAPYLVTEVAGLR